MSMFDRFKAAWADFDRRVAHFIGTAYLGEGKQRAESDLVNHVKVDTSPLYGLKLHHPFGMYFNAGDYA